MGRNTGMAILFIMNICSFVGIPLACLPRFPTACSFHTPLHPCTTKSPHRMERQRGCPFLPPRRRPHQSLPRTRPV